MKVLLIEDDSELRELLKEQFNEIGCIVSEVSNGRDGLNLLTLENFDLVLSDVDMPKMDGMEFLKKAMNLNINLPPIYIMSASSSYSKNDFLSEGASGYFDKSEQIVSEIFEDLLKV